MLVVFWWCIFAISKNGGVLVLRTRGDEFATANGGWDLGEKGNRTCLLMCWGNQSY